MISQREREMISQEQIEKTAYLSVAVRDFLILGVLERADLSFCRELVIFLN